MALVDQWKATRPWYVDSIGALAGAALGLGGGFQLLFPAAQGTMIAHRETGWEHPLRLRIIEALEKSPGIHFRELQRDYPQQTVHYVTILTVSPRKE